MTTNYYSVIEDLPTLASRVVVSFTDKKEAQDHAQRMNHHEIGKYLVVPSEITLFTPVKDLNNEPN